MSTLILVCISIATLEPKTLSIPAATVALIQEQDAAEVAQAKREALKQCRKVFPDSQLAYLKRS